MKMRDPMSTAQEILVVYGSLSVAFGMILGVPLTQARMVSAIAPHHLVVAHLAALIQGALYFGVAFGISLSALTQWLDTAAAALLVLGSALFVSGATTNWRQGVGDHFAERSIGFRLLAASGAPHLIGSMVLAAGVVSGALS